ncbi:hypothetical protein VX159_03055 [Dechloromonas sp. ZY10]|uniref:hypothetical protein n=1 Tax=Dechloromonas aquae TaxID=2664436 RepID=UPI003528C224
MSLHEHFPDYFSRIPGITLYDPLAELLGAPVDGLLHYRFSDAVRLAGHACPTVAIAWLSTTRALTALYPQSPPQRGQIEVALGDCEDAGVAGVIASIAGLLTGAAGNGGFHGLGGQHRRRSLLQFGVNGVQQLRFRRCDTSQAVACQFNLAVVPGHPQTGVLLAGILAGEASEEQRRLFASLWQQRVERILCQPEAYPGLLSLA